MYEGKNWGKGRKWTCSTRTLILSETLKGGIILQYERTSPLSSFNVGTATQPKYIQVHSSTHLLQYIASAKERVTEARFRGLYRK